MILAGANSSGKTSIVQPLLLLKQTLARIFHQTYSKKPLLMA
jgi:predicted ATPase